MKRNILFLFLIIQNLIGISNANPPKKEAEAPQLVYEQWYQIIQNNDQKIAYYSEKVTRVGKQIQFKYSIWKKESKKNLDPQEKEIFDINREEISAFANDSKNFEPDTFTMYEKTGDTKMMIDGTFKKNNTIEVTQKKNDEKSSKKSLPVQKEIIFSVFFPLWIAQRFEEAKKEPLTMNVYVEGAKGQKYQEMATAKLLPPDELAKNKDAQKIMITYLGQTSTWWIKKNGEVEFIDMPESNVKAKKVSATEALKTFNF